MKYFESITGQWDYLIQNPKKADVLANAIYQGVTAILPDSNNRAVTIETDDTIYLQSYDTVVCYIVKKSGEFVRTWGDYSATTMKHINTFRESHGLKGLNKKQWLAL